MKLAQLPWALFAFFACVNATPTPCAYTIDRSQKFDQTTQPVTFTEFSQILKTEIKQPAEDSTKDSKPVEFDNVKALTDVTKEAKFKKSKRSNNKEEGKPQEYNPKQPKNILPDAIEEAKFEKSEKSEKSNNNEEKDEERKLQEYHSKQLKNILPDPSFEGILWLPKGTGAEISKESHHAHTGTRSALLAVHCYKSQPSFFMQNVSMPKGKEFTITGWYRIVMGDIREDDMCRILFKTEGGFISHPVPNGQPLDDYRYFSLVTLGWIPGKSLTLMFECGFNFGKDRNIAIAVDDLVVAEGRAKLPPGGPSEQTIEPIRNRPVSALSFSKDELEQHRNEFATLDDWIGESTIQAFDPHGLG